MPLRVTQGVEIPVERSPSRELLSGFSDDNLHILPTEAEPGPGDLFKRLGVQTVTQHPLNMWCWAACAEMVLRFFGTDRDKCRIVGAKLGRKCCDEAAQSCDTGLSVEGIGEAFAAVGLAGKLFEKLSFESIRRRINGDPAQGIPPRPVVAGIKWQGGGGHVVVISGWRKTSDTLRYLKVNDPFYTSGDIRYDDLADNYGPNNNGKWLYTWADFRRV